MEINIFDTYTFSDKKIKSAYEYLWDLKNGLIAKTRAELTINVKGFSIINVDLTNSIGYVLYVVAPHLGNYKKKILSISESRNHYPVTITNELSHDVYKNVSEAQLLDIIEKIIMHPLVKKSIEDLYKMSKESRKNS